MNSYTHDPSALSPHRGASRMASFAFCLVALIALFAAATPAQQSGNLLIYGLTTDNRLVSFRSSTPDVTSDLGAITGVRSGESILGMDFRPANGRLYLLTRTENNGGALYIVNIQTARAFFVSTLSPVVGDDNPFDILVGNEFGIDFNPVPDRLRVVSDTGQNLRINVDTGATTTDGTLNMTPAPSPSATASPTPMTVTGITGAAYTNNFPGATGTTLYDINFETDELLIQSPPNAGTLVRVGSLGVDAGALVGFDIAPTGLAVAAFDFFQNQQPTGGGAATDGVVAGSPSRLFSINLTTGAATPLSTTTIGSNNKNQIGTGDTGTLRDIATFLVPPPFITALRADGSLVRFNSATPGTVVSSTPITGIMGTPIGIDFRPRTGVLYLVTNDGGTGRIYTVDRRTGAATLASTLTADPADMTAPFMGLSGTSFGVDFNPVPDRLRVISDTNQNLRINVDTGATTTDGMLAFASPSPSPSPTPTPDPNAGDDPVATGAAYTNNFNGTMTTTLFDIETGNDVLVTQAPPNSGTLNTVGSLGLDATELVGFDITPGSGTPFAALNTAASTAATRLYHINLVSGLASQVTASAIGGGQPITGLAIEFPFEFRLRNNEVSANVRTETGTITLDRPAPAGGVRFDLSSSDPTVTVPATFFIPEGRTSGTFTITINGTSNTTRTVNITARSTAFGGVNLVQTLRVLPVRVAMLTFNPNPVAGGETTTGTVTLNAPAPAGGTTVTLTSNRPDVAQPTTSSIVIPEGETMGTFTVQTFFNSGTRTAFITASANGASVRRQLTVQDTSSRPQ